MKKIYTIILMTLSVTLAKATVHTVQVLGGSFSPSTVTAICGDTVLWIWTGGTHTTTSTTIPGCATAWDSPIDASTTFYGIAIPCAGTYNYECTTHGFTGVINVTSCPSGIEATGNENPISITPNPSISGIFNIKFTDYNNMPQRVYVVSAVGKKIMDVLVGAIHESPLHQSSQGVINLQSCAPGVYFLVTENEKGRRVYKMVR